MNSLAKLKEQARNHELREEWSQAATVYLEVLNKAGEGEVGELALYNRVGDLYLRLGEAEKAVRYYEQAADQYAEAGLFNNAIALCNKALRYAPTRMDLLRKLGRFSASQGFLTDARRWFLDYCERAIRAGDADSATGALDEYVRMSDDAEAREAIARKLAAAALKEAAVKEFCRALAMRRATGEMAAAAALEEEIRDRFPDVEDFPIDEPPSADDENRRTAEPSARARPAAPETVANPEGGDIAPPIGLPGFDDRPAASREQAGAPGQRRDGGGTLRGLEQTSLADGGADVEADVNEDRPDGLETTRLASTPDPGTGDEEAADHADDMDWLRGRHYPGAAQVAAASGSTTEAEPERKREDFVDLSDLLGISEDGKKETRWFVDESEPTGDEDRDFEELLGQFKEKLAEHIAHDDAGAHYDLGIAFKEMGLLDEAIGEFQVALRGNGERLKIMEELGHCFFLKEHHNVAIQILKRALELETTDELERIGVYYYLGRAYEEQGQQDEARDAYERVVGLDIGFQDVSDRMARL